MTVLITGGAGFIGSNFLEHLITCTNEEVICIDKLTYAIEFVKDRPGHDRRYSTDISKIENEIGWSPRFDLEFGLDKTIKYYLDQ